jgi:hypothetical protein
MKRTLLRAQCSPSYQLASSSPRQGLPITAISMTCFCDSLSLMFTTNINLPCKVRSTAHLHRLSRLSVWSVCVRQGCGRTVKQLFCRTTTVLLTQRCSCTFHEGVLKSGGTASLIRNLSTRWMWVVSYPGSRTILSFTYYWNFVVVLEYNVV